MTKKITAFGDSLTIGTGASPASNSWIGLFSPLNKAVSGGMALDVSNKVCGNGGNAQIIPTVDDRYTVFIGQNDHRIYKNNADQQEYFKKFLTGSVVWLSCPVKHKAMDLGVTYTGTWAKTPDTTTGKYTVVQGATCTFSASGTTIYVGYLIHPQFDGTADVSVDGAFVGTVSCKGFSPACNSSSGATYGMAVTRFSGLTDGMHSVTLTVTSANGKYFLVEFVSGNDQSFSPDIFVGNVIKMPASGYTQYGTNEANVTALNSIISNMINQLNSDGFTNIKPVELFSVVDPATDFYDGIHPNNSGHEKIHNCFVTAMS